MRERERERDEYLKERYGERGRDNERWKVGERGGGGGEKKRERERKEKKEERLNLPDEHRHCTCHRI